MNSSKSKIEYRPDIDGLRALAIIPVVAYHAFPSYTPGGFVGVDIFFVISGFLISLIIFKGLSKNNFSFIDFYFHRIKRIFPALIIVVSACYVIGWLTLLPIEFKQLGKHIASGMMFVQNFSLWKEAGYFDAASELKPLMHLWSLAVEEQFYLIFPLLIWLAWKAKLNTLTFLILLGITSFILNLKGIDKNATKTFFFPQTRFWELILGGVIAYFYAFNNLQSTLKNKANSVIFNNILFREIPNEDQQKYLLKNTTSLIGFSFIIYSIFTYDHTTIYPGFKAALPVTGAALLIISGPTAWVNKNILTNKLCIWIGLISYPLYLWHWPLLSFARIIESETPSSTIRLLAVVVSIILSALTYYLVEKRIRSGESSLKKIGSLILLGALAGCIGLYTYLKDGFESRFPKIVKELTSYEYDVTEDYRSDTCFLNPEQDHTFFKQCDSESNKDKKIFIWGDSHAAHLYQGFKSRYSSEYSIIQRTASGCPPIIDLNLSKRRHCKLINDNNIQEIKNTLPDVVVLSAFWPNYDLRKLDATINKISTAGIKKILIIGPSPHWNDGLPKQLANLYKNKSNQLFPERIISGLNKNFILLDEELKTKLLKYSVQYISTKDIFCNSEGCLTRIGNTDYDLTAWDYGHLTKSGSIYLVSKFPDI